VDPVQAVFDALIDAGLQVEPVGEIGEVVVANVHTAYPATDETYLVTVTLSRTPS